MNLLPVFGLIIGFTTRRYWAILVTALAAGIGFALVAVFTDEISGWDDLYVWGDLIISLVVTWLGVVGGKWFWGRRAARRLK